MAVRHGKRLYKQMALEVAVRNPERYESLLKTFVKFEGEILDDDCILRIYSQLYIDKAIEANDLDESNLNYTYLKEYIPNTKRHNNEWGFPTGYQAAFVRYLKTLSEFGFIYSQYNEKLRISQVAKKVIGGIFTLSEAFALQSLRFWRKSPYRRVLNDFNYFEFIFRALIKRSSQNKNISYPQLMYSLFSDNGNVDEYLTTIENNKIGSSLEESYNLAKLNYSEKTSEHQKISKFETSYRDYGNTVFRVLQLTGFVTVDYEGIILLKINKNRLGLLNELLNKKFKISEEAKEDYLLYFEELGSCSKTLENLILSYREVENLSTVNYKEKIPTILNNYGLTKEKLANYLVSVSKGDNDNNVFWFIQAPLKFELLLTLFIYSCYGDEFDYKPNFKCDDKGIPYSHAPGNIGDIEIYKTGLYWLIEATLISNKNQQINAETVNLFRHIDDRYEGEKFLTLVAPYIHSDTEMIIKASTLISMVEKNSPGFYSIAQKTGDFAQTTMIKENFKLMKSYSSGFISQIKDFLNDEENLIYFI